MIKVTVGMLGARGVLGMLGVAAALVGMVVCAGCGAGGGAVPSAVSPAAPSGNLAAGDVIRVSYPGAPEFNQSLRIQADGNIGLPMVGSVAGSGRSPSALQAALSTMYAPHLNDPTVFVSLEQPAASVYVSGEVGNPGKVLLVRPTTALEAVMEVGGFSKLANPKKVYVIRNEGGSQKRYVLNLGDPLRGNESRAFYLRAYDVIYVERSRW
jgi:polysaccharide export outer membrane protein